MTNYPPEFEGDGRRMLVPVYSLPGTQPKQVTRKQARDAIDRLLASGHSFHSGQGATLWVVLAYCAHARQPYTLTAQPGEGYGVEFLK